MNDSAVAGERAALHAPTPNPLEQLLDQVCPVELLLQLRLHEQQQRPDDKHDLAGLVLNADEMARARRAAGPLSRWSMDRGPPPGARPSADRRAAPPIAATSRLGLLAERFGLNAFECDVLLLGLLTLLDNRYALLFAFIQDDPHKSLPSLEFALTLLCRHAAEKAARRVSLAPHGPLLRDRLLSVAPGPRRGTEAFDARTFQTDPAIVDYLLGHDYLPAAAEACGRWLAADTAIPAGHARLAGTLRELLGARPAGGPPLLLLRGPRGSGRGAVVASAAAVVGRRVLRIDAALLPDDEQDALEVCATLLREVRLRDACLVLDGLPELAQAEGRRRVFAALARRLPAYPLPVVVLLEPGAPLVWCAGLPQLLLELPARSVADEAALLRSRLPAAVARAAKRAPGPDLGIDLDIDLDLGLDIEALVTRFHVAPEALDDALREADLHRRQRAPDARLSAADLQAAFRLRSQQNFGQLAQRIEPRRTFDDLTVDAALRRQLDEILAAIKHREHALEQGFARKVGYGTGISALFYGDSGTGKTMVAEVLAGALGVDLIKVDLSTVVNKYIGETEKNLARIFDLAAADSGVLFFDEADALFGKRSETKDAHDRHANIEVSYLLQRLESYPGLVVLATNNRSHLDDAFNRRLTFITHFTFPDQALRETLWRNIWPERVAVAPEVDFAALAAKAEITGANIRNIAMLAYWLALDAGAAAVGNTHVQRALRRELDKIGRLGLGD